MAWQSAAPSGLWYWRIVAPNGKTIADGGEGYAKRHNALRAARRLKIIAADAVIR